MLTAVSLLRKGYFPRELPPPFTTVPVGDLLEAEPGTAPSRRQRTESARHNLARPGGFRRPLKVPNPKSFTRLAAVFEAQWPEIANRLGHGDFAMSRPIVTRTMERAVRPRYRVGERERLRPRHWSGQRFVLRSDINQFYSSLYTHSIPWALHTKAFAKANMGNTDGDKIDEAFRDSADGQTVGVPIGPDTSLLASEIVLAAVDQILGEAITPLRGHRYIDDYELAFPTRLAAEQAQGALELALAEYELAINPAKTQILELPQPFHEGWTHELSVFPIRDASTTQTIADLIALFSRAADLSRRHAGPLKFALLKSRGINIEAEAVWRPFQGLIWSAVSAEPTTMPAALDLLGEKAAEGSLEIDRDAAGEVIDSIIAAHAPVRNASEVAWAIWCAIALEVELTPAAACAVAAMDDDFVALLALDAQGRGRIAPGALDCTGWENLVAHDRALSGPHWLLAYEGAMQGWIESSKGLVAKDPFFKLLRKHQIHFYDTEPGRNPFTGPAGPLPGGLVPDEYL